MMSQSGALALDVAWVLWTRGQAGAEAAEAAG